MTAELLDRRTTPLVLPGELAGLVVPAQLTYPAGPYLWLYVGWVVALAVRTLPRR